MCAYSIIGLCSWVINIVKFYEVYCDVEPKRMALEAANAELAAAQEKLTKIKAKIKVSQIQHVGCSVFSVTAEHISEVQFVSKTVLKITLNQLRMYVAGISK